MEKRGKGNLAEREVEEILKRKGYITDRARQSYFRVRDKTFTRSNDFFNLFDIIAKKLNSSTLYIQVSWHYRKAEKEKKMKESKNFFNSLDRIFLWLRFEGKIFKIYEYDFSLTSFIEIGKYERGKIYLIDKEKEF